jgi:hypothetical protein
VRSDDKAILSNVDSFSMLTQIVPKKCGANFSFYEFFGMPMSDRRSD